MSIGGCCREMVSCPTITTIIYQPPCTEYAGQQCDTLGAIGCGHGRVGCQPPNRKCTTGINDLRGPCMKRRKKLIYRHPAKARTEKQVRLREV